MKTACKNTRDHLFEFSENSLPEIEKEKLEKHLAQCHECSSLFEYFNQHVINSPLNQPIYTDNYFYTRVSGRLQPAIQKKFTLKHLFENRIVRSFSYVVLMIVAVLIGINIGSFNKNTSREKNIIASDLTVNKNDEYGKFSSADQIFYNQYLNLIENGNNSEKNENY